VREIQREIESVCERDREIERESEREREREGEGSMIHRNQHIVACCQCIYHHMC
jgi:hypothetical protein